MYPAQCFGTCCGQSKHRAIFQVGAKVLIDGMAVAPTQTLAKLEALLAAPNSESAPRAGAAPAAQDAVPDPRRSHGHARCVT